MVPQADEDSLRHDAQRQLLLHCDLVGDPSRILHMDNLCSINASGHIPTFTTFPSIDLYRLPLALRQSCRKVLGFRIVFQGVLEEKPITDCVDDDELEEGEQGQHEPHSTHNVDGERRLPIPRMHFLSHELSRIGLLGNPQPVHGDEVVVDLRDGVNQHAAIEENQCQEGSQASLGQRLHEERSTSRRTHDAINSGVDNANGLVDLFVLDGDVHAATDHEENGPYERRPDPSLGPRSEEEARAALLIPSQLVVGVEEDANAEEEAAEACQHRPAPQGDEDQDAREALKNEEVGET
mmetsp:Transcript_24716/g.53760  ORF Transcript_24716/g.53760 Transcript_24716/m.53760 type:complete len:295 (-) Transcript_24716:758-1642(-)